MTPQQQTAIRRYNQQLVDTAQALKGADPRPGKMTPEQNKAQCALVSAWLDVEESGAFQPDQD